MKLILTMILLLFSASLKAPEARTLFLSADIALKPYRVIQEAIGYVESKFDTTVINYKEDAYGYYQVRAIRLEDYYQRTGVRYSLTDMLDYKKAERVFLYYATQYRYDDYRGIAYDWNKSKTNRYYSKVKKHLTLNNKL